MCQTERQTLHRTNILVFFVDLQDPVCDALFGVSLEPLLETPPVQDAIPQYGATVHQLR
jgi:hypothetical protein